MVWEVVLGGSAKRALRKLPKDDATRIGAALKEMELDPFSGDITALRGVYKGSFRRRIGSWRLLFDIVTEDRRVIILDIRRRTSTTY